MSTALSPIPLPCRPLSIALLEDDAELREQILLPGLRHLGFDVTAMASAAELYLQLPQTSFDILVLDVGLPDQDGFTVTRYLRSASSIGIVMLTGRGGAADRVHGLSMGADAYLAKPVNMDVLAATLHSLGRRLGSGPVATSHEKARPGWRLHSNGWSLVTPGGGAVTLTLAERCVLGQLMAKAGEAVSRETLIAALTPDIYDFDPHRLETLIHRLRRKVSHATREALPLRALHGVGYVMVS
jgi:two-component system, OmpR family, response regulator PhoP